MLTDVSIPTANLSLASSLIPDLLRRILDDACLPKRDVDTESYHTAISRYSLVCRHWHTVARELNYTSINLRHPLVWSSRTAQSLIRTLDDNPTLLSTLQQLSIKRPKGEHDWWGFERSSTIAKGVNFLQRWNVHSGSVEGQALAMELLGRTKLRTLRLEGFGTYIGGSLDAENLMNLARAMESVEELDLSHCSMAGELLTWTTSLRKLSLFNCRAVDFSQSNADYPPLQLTSCTLVQTPISAASLRALLGNATALRDLTISNCEEGISYNDLAETIDVFSRSLVRLVYQPLPLAVRHAIGIGRLPGFIHPPPTTNFFVALKSCPNLFDLTICPLPLYTFAYDISYFPSSLASLSICERPQGRGDLATLVELFERHIQNDFLPHLKSLALLGQSHEFQERQKSLQLKDLWAGELEEQRRTEDEAKMTMRALGVELILLE